MKPLIKYISLLIFSGLILPFCACVNARAVRFSAQNPAVNTTETLPYIYREIANTLLPVLTNLK